MLWTIIIVLIILWLLGFFGRNISPRFPRTGNWIHVLIVIVVILVILQLLGVVHVLRLGDWLKYFRSGWWFLILNPQSDLPSVFVAGWLEMKDGILPGRLASCSFHL
jgi:hypothetical protein